MILLGIVLIVVGLLVAIPVLYWIGLVLVVVGLVLWLVPIGGHTRRWY